MPDTLATGTTFYDLVETLPADTDWDGLKRALETRLQDAPTTLTIPQRQLLEGLRLRERCLVDPYYAEQDQRGPDWWISLKGSAMLAMA